MTLAQRRQFQRHDVDPVVEILAEMALSDLLFHIAVGCGQQAHIHAPLFERTDAPHGTVFQHA